LDSFCDEQGHINTDFPSIIWQVGFHPVETGTKVIVLMTFENESDVQKLVEIGVESGFAAALTNLDELLKHIK
ncbi:MAG: hypothetical protein JWM28_2588, partial [Chitinophagaceae bacterium]|nr:hypothetical protein [Chitinophagaceae bacterium]